MENFGMKVHSFNELEPVSLDEVKGGENDPCCKTNYSCNVNTPVPPTPPIPEPIKPKPSEPDPVNPKK